jgi:hypothetical protein
MAGRGAIGLRANPRPAKSLSSLELVTLEAAGNQS